MQKVYISAYLNRDSYAGRSSFATWLTRITINEALAHRRARNRRSASESIEGAAAQVLDAGPSPEDSVAARELGRLVESVLATLPVDYREILLLREVQGMDGYQAAECLGVSAEVVRVRLCRARALLRVRLCRTGDWSPP